MSAVKATRTLFAPTVPPSSPERVTTETQTEPATEVKAELPAREESLCAGSISDSDEDEAMYADRWYLESMTEDLRASRVSVPPQDLEIILQNLDRYTHEVVTYVASAKYGLKFPTVFTTRISRFVSLSGGEARATIRWEAVAGRWLGASGRPMRQEPGNIIVKYVWDAVRDHFLDYPGMKRQPGSTVLSLPAKFFYHLNIFLCVLFPQNMVEEAPCRRVLARMFGGKRARE
mgnify:CR=1 FL=1